jgi:hypothetical protein
MVCRLNNRGKRQIQNPVSTWFSTELLNGDYEQIQHGTPQQICGDRLAELDVRVRLFFACARSEYSPLELSPVNHMFTLTWVPAWSTPVLSHVFWSCMWYHRLDWAWDSTNIILLVARASHYIPILYTPIYTHQIPYEMGIVIPTKHPIIRNHCIHQHWP